MLAAIAPAFGGVRPLYRVPALALGQAPGSPPLPRRPPPPPGPAGAKRGADRTAAFGRTVSACVKRDRLRDGDGEGGGEECVQKIPWATRGLHAAISV